MNISTVSGLLLIRIFVEFFTLSRNFTGESAFLDLKKVRFLKSKIAYLLLGSDSEFAIFENPSSCSGIDLCRACFTNGSRRSGIMSLPSSVCSEIVSTSSSNADLFVSKFPIENLKVLGEQSGDSSLSCF